VISQKDRIHQMIVHKLSGLVRPKTTYTRNSHVITHYIQVRCLLAVFKIFAFEFAFLMYVYCQLVHSKWRLIKLTYLLS